MIRNEREFNNGGKRENVIAVGCTKGKHERVKGNYLNF